MSTTIAVNVTRAGTPVGSSSILLQLDLMNQADAAAYGGASSGEGPYFRYNGYTEAPLTFMQGDLLTDTTANDPLTSAKMKYRVIGLPEAFDDGHVEMVLDRVIGT